MCSALDVGMNFDSGGTSQRTRCLRRQVKANGGTSIFDPKAEFQAPTAQGRAAVDAAVGADQNFRGPSPRYCLKWRLHGSLAIRDDTDHIRRFGRGIYDDNVRT